jgi:uncharacterized membrane protein
VVVKRVGVVLAFVLGAFLIVRAVVEPFVVDMSDPATYRHDWGGPSLFGVLLVHCGPGVIAAVLFAVLFVNRRSRGHSRLERGAPEA